MSNPLTTFIFEGASIRVFGDSVSPLFVAADICNALNLTNPSMAIASLAPFERAKLNLVAGKPDVNVVNESGLYTLILRSRDAVKEGTPAYRFRVKVTNEILPAIRKTGSYSAATLNIAVFGCTAAEYKNTNPEPKGNMRDNASIEQLLILNQLESQNALLIRQGWPKPRRLRYLCVEAQRQMKSLTTHGLPGADELKKIP